MNDPTMGRCKDCEWWAEEPPWPKGSLTGLVYEMRGECMRQYEEHNTGDRNFMAAGEPGCYQAPLYTGPEFGCILFSGVSRKV